MIVTIDGPAGAGKSSVAKQLAARLCFQFLDTGAMYRCVALAALRQGIPWDDKDRLVAMAAELDIDVNSERVLLDGEDVTEAIRRSAVTQVIHHVADCPKIRGQLVDLQRRTAGGGNGGTANGGGDFVTEGRDQGTVAFPDAVCKIFLVASPEERAKRRQVDLRRRGEDMPLAEVLEKQNERDERDRCRVVGRLVAAGDAIYFDSDGLTIEEVVDQIEKIVRNKIENHRREHKEQV